MRILVFLLLISSSVFAQVQPPASRYTPVNSTGYNWLRGYFRALHLPNGDSILTSDQWDGPGAIKYKTSDSSVYIFNGFFWEKQLNIRDTSIFSGGGGNGGTKVKGSPSILITPDGDSSSISVKDVYIDNLVEAQLADSAADLRGVIIDTAAALRSAINTKGTVSTITVSTANGFTGSSNGNATNPALTIGTDRTGLLYGNGTAMSGRKVGADFTWATDTLKNGSYVNVRDYGATGDNVTNDRTAFLNAIATGKNVYVPPGSYYLNGPSDGGWQLTLSANQKIFGDGYNSKIRINSNTRLIKISNNCVVSGLNLEGSGKSAGMAWQVGVFVYEAIGFSVEDCYFTGFSGLAQQNGGGAIYLVAIAPANSDGGRLSNNYFYNNNAAVSFGQRGEYVVVSNNTFGNNNVAVGVGAGNVAIVGNVIQNNITGIRMFTGVNNAHNLVSDNLINHNTYPIDITDVPYTTGLTFTNNHVFNGALKIKDAKNVKFSDCQFQFLDSIYLDNTSDIQFVNTWVGRTSGNATIPIRYYNGATEIATIGQMRNINGTPNRWINQVLPDTISLVGPSLIRDISADTIRIMTPLPDSDSSSKVPTTAWVKDLLSEYGGGLPAETISYIDSLYSGLIADSTQRKLIVGLTGNYDSVYTYYKIYPATSWDSTFEFLIPKYQNTGLITAGTNVSLTGTGTPGDPFVINATGGSSGIAVGTTTVTGGTSGRIPYNNAGVVGEKDVTGTGKVVLENSAALTGNPTAPTLATSATGTGIATAGLVDAKITDLTMYSIVDGSWANLSPTGSKIHQYFGVRELSSNITINAPSGTFGTGNSLLIRLDDNGTARTITWNSVYMAGDIPLPTTTTVGKVMYGQFVSDGFTGTWSFIGLTYVNKPL